MVYAARTVDFDCFLAYLSKNVVLSSPDLNIKICSFGCFKVELKIYAWFLFFLRLIFIVHWQCLCFSESSGICIFEVFLMFFEVFVKVHGVCFFSRDMRPTIG